MSSEEGGGRCPRNSQGGLSEEVTSFEGLTAGEEAAAAPARGLKAADLSKACCSAGIWELGFQEVSRFPLIGRPHGRSGCLCKQGGLC